MLRSLLRFSTPALIIATSCIVSCSDDNPKPSEAKTPKKPEPINAFFMEAYHENEIEPGWMDFDDRDNDGIIEALGYLSLKRGTQFRFELQGFGFWKSPTEWVPAPIPARLDDHLVCFEVTNGVLISNGYSDFDKDSNGLPTGLSTLWTTSSVAKTGSIKITLYHQPKIKTGDCEVSGSLIDFETILPIQIF